MSLRARLSERTQSVIFAKKAWNEDDYEGWYRLHVQIQDKLSAWVVAHSELLNGHTKELETTLMQWAKTKAELRENRERLNR